MDQQAQSPDIPDMHIVHVMAGGVAGGAEMAFVDTCIAQHEAGWDVTAVCRPNAKRNGLLRDAGVPVYEYPFGGRLDILTKWRLRRLFRHIRPDIVQCWMSRAAQKTPADPRSYVKIARLGGYYNLKYYRDVSHFIANTPDIRRWLVEEQGRPAENVTVVNNFADLGTPAAPVERVDLDTKIDDFVFLALSRLHPVKGLDTALEALAKVEGAVLWIAGDGPEDNALKALADRLGVRARVRFLGWRTDRSALLSACDAVLFPSRFEPFGGTFAQAWAAGRPLVTTLSQGPAQYVTHGSDALAVPVDDAYSMARAMRAIMDDPAMRERLAENGYKRYEELFTKRRVLDTYADLYHNLRK